MTAGREVARKSAALRQSRFQRSNAATEIINTVNEVSLKHGDQPGMTDRVDELRRREGSQGPVARYADTKLWAAFVLSGVGK